MSGFIAEHRKRSNAKLISRIVLVKGDITQQADVDAIVSTLMANMDVDGTLNRSLIEAAGQAFDEFVLDNIYKPRPGDTFVVPGFNLPVKNVIFVVTPLWRDNFDKEDVYLLRCYRHALELARNMGLKKVAFAALGTGSRGYSLDRAARLAIQGIMDRMQDDIAEVRIVCNDDKVYDAFLERLKKYGTVKLGEKPQSMP